MSDKPRVYLKYLGSKAELAPTIAPLMPADLPSRLYREPFVGAGGMYFWLAGEGLVRPETSSLSDGWEAVVACHRAIASSAEEVMEELDVLIRAFIRANAEGRAEQLFYEYRAELNRRITGPAASVRLRGSLVAALLIFINKTCFRGVMRTNRRGEFNAPFGFSEAELAVSRTANKSPVTVYDRLAILAASRALAGCDLACEDFGRSLTELAIPGEVVYLDPPYVPASATASFVGYGGGWRDADHERLGEVFRELDARGCLLVLSNSDTERTRRIYAGYDIVEVDARRSIGARFEDTDRRAREVVVRNLDMWPVAAKRSGGDWMASDKLLTDDEILSLKQARHMGDQAWNDACNDVKRARGGCYPRDWYQRVIVGGLLPDNAKITVVGFSGAGWPNRLGPQTPK